VKTIAGGSPVFSQRARKRTVNRTPNYRVIVPPY